MRLEFLGQVLEKLLIVKFHENPSVGNGVVPCGKTYRQTSRSSLSLFVTLQMSLIQWKWREASSQYEYSGNRTQISTNHILRPTENEVNSPPDYINFTHKRWKPRHQCLSNSCYCWRSCKEIIKLFRTRRVNMRVHTLHVSQTASVPHFVRLENTKKKKNPPPPPTSK